MRLQTDRLIICEFDLSMAEDVHKNSLDEDTKRFVPDNEYEIGYPLPSLISDTAMPQRR